MGTCGGKFYLASMCVVDVEVVWYRNGTVFDPRAESSQYTLSSTGELRIRRLTEMTVGYYVCVTTVNGLGKYQTVDVNIVLALPSESLSVCSYIAMYSSISCCRNACNSIKNRFINCTTQLWWSYYSVIAVCNKTLTNNP